MAPTLILVRHAQALHNVDQDYSLHDPVLSQLGREQCSALRAKLIAHPLANRATRIVVSPMRRTLETALLSLDWLMAREGRGIKVEADADWQENSSKPCDTGSEVGTVMDEFSAAGTLGHCIDWSRVKASTFPDKTSPGSPYAHTRVGILGRAQRALTRLHKDYAEDEVIIVVAHSGFLRLGVTGCFYFNADFRIFDFEEVKEADVAGGTGYRLKEHESTRENGGGLGLSRKDMLVLGSDLPDETPPTIN